MLYLFVHPHSNFMMHVAAHADRFHYPVYLGTSHACLCKKCTVIINVHFYTELLLHISK